MIRGRIKRSAQQALLQNPVVDETREMNIVKVSFLVGKFGEKIPVVDSFVFYPKDRDKVRFACKTRGCNGTMTMVEGVNGPICARVRGKQTTRTMSGQLKTLCICIG